MNRKERKNFMKPYESYMIISDLDGTIIPHGGCVSEANKQAIESFLAGGGHFGIATGRTPEAAAWPSRHRVSSSTVRCSTTGSTSASL